MKIENPLRKPVPLGRGLRFIECFYVCRRCGLGEKKEVQSLWIRYRLRKWVRFDGSNQLRGAKKEQMSAVAVAFLNLSRNFVGQRQSRLLGRIENDIPALDVSPYVFELQSFQVPGPSSLEPV